MAKTKKITSLLRAFRIPVTVLMALFVYLALKYSFHLELAAAIVAYISVLLGSYSLFVETYQGLKHKQYALDYIAILAIIVSIITQQYAVAIVLALMLSSGRTLEEYGVNQAKLSLTTLASRIPDEVIVWESDTDTRKEPISNITKGQKILVRKGEVIPLDGTLASKNGITDESSLTGEPYLIDKIEGDILRSGTVNAGEAIVIEVTQNEEGSTYKKIVNMVTQAQTEKAPLVRLADKYSTIFTIITFIIALVAYILHRDLNAVLSVLVVATPCPLILATPIALMGGVNAAAKKRIIVKRLASLESLAKAKAVIFDKTGTITLGTPKLIEMQTHNTHLSEIQIYAIAEAIERNSLHPLAKAVVDAAKSKHAPIIHAENIEEHVGSGISGVIKGKTYRLTKHPQSEGMAIALYENDVFIAVFRFEDVLKPESKKIMKHLKKDGLDLFIFTGDKEEAAKKVADQLEQNVTIKAHCTPLDKKEGIEKLKHEGKTTVMVGDGINDAPALAYADVGMVFSNQEQTAASEAADVVFLGGDFSLVHASLTIAQRTIKIALQSILFGIGLSIVAMIFAAIGFIPPVVGAFLQEAIDVAVIINALRASR